MQTSSSEVAPADHVQAPRTGLQHAGRVALITARSLGGLLLFAGAWITLGMGPLNAVSAGVATGFLAGWIRAPRIVLVAALVAIPVLYAGDYAACERELTDDDCHWSYALDITAAPGPILLQLGLFAAASELGRRRAPRRRAPR